MDDRTLRRIKEKFYAVIGETSYETPKNEPDVALEVGLQTDAELRKYIIRPQRIISFPIGNKSKHGTGIFLAHTADELDETIADLTSRRNSYYEVIKGLEIAQIRLRCGHNPLEMQESLF